MQDTAFSETEHIRKRYDKGEGEETLMYEMPKTPGQGNDEMYNPENLTPAVSPLNGKTLAALGSSITYGYGSEGIAFPEMIAKIDQCRFIKQAISGMTLACVPERPETHPEGSYVRQLLDMIDPSEKIDAFVVQLSTNDAQKGIEMGKISDSYASEDQDQGTIIGAMEFILAYIRETWNCPVIFYINAYLDRGYLEFFSAKSPAIQISVDDACKNLIVNYENMIHALYELQKKWHFRIADLWNNEDIRNASYELRDRMMSDPIHPRKSGYLFWYVPEIEKCLYEAFV